MTSQYSQTVEVNVPPAIKRLQWMGIISILFSAGFLVAAAAVNWYFVFGMIPFIVLGAIDLHVFNATAKEYIYDFSPKRLVVAKRDAVNRTTRALNVLFEDVVNMKLFEDSRDDGDIVAVQDAHAEGIWELTFNVEGKVRRLLFAPDDYMLELLREALGDKFTDKRVEG